MALWESAGTSTFLLITGKRPNCAVRTQVFVFDLLLALTQELPHSSPKNKVDSCTVATVGFTFMLWSGRLMQGMHIREPTATKLSLVRGSLEVRKHE